MYRPYFRGKQFELVTIRENAPLLARANFVPTIEPVKDSLAGVKRALDAVIEAGGRAVVIVNPQCGDFSRDGRPIRRLLQEGLLESGQIVAGVQLSEGMTTDEALEIWNELPTCERALVHAGFAQARQLAEALPGDVDQVAQVFLEPSCGKLYRRHFPAGERSLVRDGFTRRRNRDYPPLEAFSDLHVTFREEDMEGFGDFLTVGGEYTEAGGPAYAVAIHLTFIDPDEDNVMFVYHFVSDSQDTPTDPAGKFAEALRSMMTVIDTGNSKVEETEAVAEFRLLHERGHFPGLGYVKKLSMKHHLETFERFFGR